MGLTIETVARLMKSVRFGLVAVKNEHGIPQIVTVEYKFKTDEDIEKFLNKIL